MKLRDVLNVIGGGTDIRIYAGCLSVFHGKMCDAKKASWNEHVGTYMDCEVIRLNTVDGAITIAV